MKVQWVIIFCLFNPIVCNHFVPMKQNFTTKYSVTGKFTQFLETFQVSFDVFLKQYSEENVLEVALNNTNFTRLPNLKHQNELFPSNLSFSKFLERRVLFYWDQEGKLLPKHDGDLDENSLFHIFQHDWRLLDHNVTVARLIVEQNLTNLHTFDEKYVENGLESCQSNFKVLENDVNLIELEEIVNYTSCQLVDDPNVLNLVINNRYNKSDYTIQRKIIKYNHVNPVGIKDKEIDVVIEFKEFLPMNKSLPLFQLRNSPFENVTLSPRDLLPFQDDFDLKFHVKVVARDYLDKLNCSFDLYLREVGDEQQMFAKITDIEFYETKNVSNLSASKKAFYNLKQKEMKGRVLKYFERLTIVAFLPNGSMEYKYLDEKSGARILGGKTIYPFSISIDPDGIQELKNGGINPVLQDVTLFDYFGENCKGNYSYDLKKKLTHLFINTMNSCKLSENEQKQTFLKSNRIRSSYCLSLEQELDSNFKILKLRSKFEYIKFTDRDDFIRGDASFHLVSLVSKEQIDNDIFNLYGQVVNKTFIYGNK